MSSWLAVLWQDIDAMCAWTGNEAEKALYFDQDDHHLLDMPPPMRLYEVVDTLISES